MGIHFYASDANNTSVIFYGDTHQKKRHFKIIFTKSGYWAYKKVSSKYIQIGWCQSLEGAKGLCVISLPK